MIPSKSLFSAAPEWAWDGWAVWLLVFMSNKSCIPGESALQGLANTHHFLSRLRLHHRFPEGFAARRACVRRQNKVLIDQRMASGARHEQARVRSAVAVVESGQSQRHESET